MNWLEIFKRFTWDQEDEDFEFRGISPSGNEVLLVNVEEDAITIHFQLKFTNTEGIPTRRTYATTSLDGSIINLIPLTVFLAKNSSLPERKPSVLPLEGR